MRSRGRGRRRGRSGHVWVDEGVGGASRRPVERPRRSGEQPIAPAARRRPSSHRFFHRRRRKLSRSFPELSLVDLRRRPRRLDLQLPLDLPSSRVHDHTLVRHLFFLFLLVKIARFTLRLDLRSFRLLVLFLALVFVLLRRRDSRLCCVTPRRIERQIGSGSCEEGPSREGVRVEEGRRERLRGIWRGPMVESRAVRLERVNKRSQLMLNEGKTTHVVAIAGGQDGLEAEYYSLLVWPSSQTVV
jgi:hypothetical protein